VNYAAQYCFIRLQFISSLDPNNLHFNIFPYRLQVLSWNGQTQNLKFYGNNTLILNTQHCLYQWGYVLPSIVCLSHCLSVATSCKNFCTYHINYIMEILPNILSVDKEELIKFSTSSASRSRSRNFFMDSTNFARYGIFFRIWLTSPAYYPSIAGKLVGSPWKHLTLDKEIPFEFCMSSGWRLEIWLQIWTEFALVVVCALWVLVSVASLCTFASATEDTQHLPVCLVSLPEQSARSKSDCTAVSVRMEDTLNIKFKHSVSTRSRQNMLHSQTYRCSYPSISPVWYQEFQEPENSQLQDW